MDPILLIYMSAHQKCKALNSWELEIVQAKPPATTTAPFFLLTPAIFFKRCLLRTLRVIEYEFG